MATCLGTRIVGEVGVGNIAHGQLVTDVANIAVLKRHANGVRYGTGKEIGIGPSPAATGNHN